MRIKPSVALAVGFFVLYTAAWIGVAAVTAADGFEFGEAFETVEFSRNLVWGLLAGSLVGIAAASAFGWWPQILGRDAGVTSWHRWIPLVVLVLVLATTDYRDLPDLDVELLVWIVAASVLVGFSEELAFRGVVVVDLRAAGQREERVFWLSTLLFALIHLPNMVLGAAPAAAIAQTVFAFLAGTLFYVIRRASGTIVAAMALHALWDFTLFATSADALNAIRIVAEIGLAVAVIATRAQLFSDHDDRRLIEA